MAVTAEALMNQWADTTTIARGSAAVAEAPNDAHARVNPLTPSAFIGLPCPRNAAGIGAVAGVVTSASVPRPDARGWTDGQLPGRAPDGGPPLSIIGAPVTWPS